MLISISIVLYPFSDSLFTDSEASCTYSNSSGYLCNSGIGVMLKTYIRLVHGGAFK